ncbi:MAG: thiosulfate oxidation carrier complex protein SoxZ [Burkholderiales bacterium]|nr:thiosulfate oxidation carrier complex protein SoxZ [Burkholderiales bacterium]
MADDTSSPAAATSPTTNGTAGPSTAGTAARTLIKAPAKARRGEVMQLSALIGHVMETGFRPDGQGRTVPRNILRRFVCRYNGVDVFSAELNPAISANPYLAFSTVAVETGTLSFQWIGDKGFDHTRTLPIEVVDG